MDLILFAQQKQFGPAGGGGGAGGGAAALGVLCVYGVILAVAIGVQVMFLLTMSKCLKEISPRNRQMEPGQVWLCLIPLFGIVWTIIMILRVADSLRDEYDDRGLRGDGDFGKTIGIVYIVSAFVCGIVALVCWIMYWVKIAGYTRELQESGGRRSGRGRDDDFDDEDADEDDRPSRPRRPAAEAEEDDRPSRRRRPADEDEGDEDDRPRRRRRDDDDR